MEMTCSPPTKRGQEGSNSSKLHPDLIKKTKKSRNQERKGTITAERRRGGTSSGSLNRFTSTSHEA